jgi:hypothetical protein
MKVFKDTGLSCSDQLFTSVPPKALEQEMGREQIAK